MECEKAFELISASLDGELTADQEASLREHLAQCPSCRALRSDLSAIHTACGGLDVQPPADLAERILQSLPPQSPAKGRPKVIWIRWGSMAAAAVLVALCAWRLPSFLTGGEKNSLAQAPAAMDAPEVASPAAMDAAEVASPASGPETVAEAPAAGPEVGVTGDTAAGRNTALDSGVSGQTDFQAGATYGSVQDAGNGDAAAPGDAPTAGAKPAGAARKFAVGAAPTAATGGSAPEDLSQDLDSAAPSAAFSIQEADPLLLDVTQGAQAVSENTDGLDETVPLSTSFFASSAPQRDDLLEDEKPEAAPEVGLYDAAASPLEPVYETDGLSCGVITLSDGSPVGPYPVETWEDGASCYTLPADDWFTLLAELRQSGAAFDLRLTGDDVSSTALHGLVVVLP